MLMRKTRLFMSQSQSVGKTTGLPATSTEKFNIQGKVISMVKRIQRIHTHTHTQDIQTKIFAKYFIILAEIIS